MAKTKTWSSSPQFTINFEYIINHIGKNKNRKNHKISSTFVSEYCAFFWYQKPNIAIFEGWGQGGLHVVNWDRTDNFDNTNLFMTIQKFVYGPQNTHTYAEQGVYIAQVYPNDK